MYKKLLFFTLAFLLTFISVSAQTKNPNRVRTVDVQHYKIGVDFNRKLKSISGDTTISFKPLGKNFKTLELDATGMKFSSVRLEPSGKVLNYSVKPNKIIVTLDKSYDSNDEISVNFKYTAKPRKGIYFVDPVIENGKITRHAQVWTQGEPEEAHHWFPSYDFPDDKATTEQFLTANAGETVIANGNLIEQKKNPNGKTVFHYKMDVPHSTYLTSFVIGTYDKVSDKYGEIPLGFYVYKGLKPIANKAYGKTKDMFVIFEELTGIAYPYNKYDQTMVANFNFGGMENITATTMADTEIMLAEIIPGAVEDLVSHELAHSWFGNLVTCKNWSELWLNEGFATFMEAAYREKMYGRDDYIRKVLEDAEQFKAFDAVTRQKHGLYNLIADPNNDGTMFDTTTYQKGGAVIHTLREEIGDEAFWRAVNIYLNRHKFANVETKDLQKVMEETSGRKLDWFFKQWVYGSSYPKIFVEKSFDNNVLTLKLTQTQKADGLTPAVFNLPLEIEIETDGAAKTEKIEFNKRTQTFTFNLDGEPTEVLIDKNEKIPLKMVAFAGDTR